MSEVDSDEETVHFETDAEATPLHSAVHSQMAPPDAARPKHLADHAARSITETVSDGSRHQSSLRFEAELDGISSLSRTETVINDSHPDPYSEDLSESEAQRHLSDPLLKLRRDRKIRERKLHKQRLRAAELAQAHAQLEKGWVRPSRVAQRSVDPNELVDVGLNAVLEATCNGSDAGLDSLRMNGINRPCDGRTKMERVKEYTRTLRCPPSSTAPAGSHHSNRSAAPQTTEHSAPKEQLEAFLKQLQQTASDTREPSSDHPSSQRPRASRSHESDFRSCCDSTASQLSTESDECIAEPDETSDSGDSPPASPHRRLYEDAVMRQQRLELQIREKQQSEAPRTPRPIPQATPKICSRLYDQGRQQQRSRELAAQKAREERRRAEEAMCQQARTIGTLLQSARGHNIPKDAAKLAETLGTLRVDRQLTAEELQRAVKRLARVKPPSNAVPSEMQNCTFTPKVNHERPSYGHPIEVRLYNEANKLRNNRARMAAKRGEQRLQQMLEAKKAADHHFAERIEEERLNGCETTKMAFIRSLKVILNIHDDANQAASTLPHPATSPHPTRKRWVK